MSGFDPRILRDGLLNRTVDGRNIVVEELLVFQRPHEVGGEIITIPVGATSDGMSTPRALWDVLPPFGETTWLPAVLHDFGYRLSGRPFRECNLWIFEAMLARGASLTKARLVFNALEEFGEKAFADDRAARAVAP
jgi:hypothetical protein